MTCTSIESATVIRPFSVKVPEEELADLRRRIAATRWPEKETVADQSQGVQLATMQALARYWATDSDFGRVEARLNEFPQFMTEIDGLDIHFIHVESQLEDALPLIMTHGWPGSIIEMLNVIGPLSDPTAHGGDAEDAFDVVVPSMPGYGFSGKPTETGWDPVHARDGARCPRPAADAIRGGTCGPRRARHLQDERQRLLPGAGHASADDRLRAAGLTGRAGGLDARPRHRQLLQDLPRLRRWAARGQPHARPHPRQHHGVLADRHWGLGGPVVLGAGTSPSPGSGSWAGSPQVSLPVGFTTFPGEIFRAPRSWVEAGYPKVTYFNEADKGGHFAAWEEPDIFSTEVRAAFRWLR
jgi:Epoxide hydrolase N terminus